MVYMLANKTLTNVLLTSSSTIQVHAETHFLILASICLLNFRSST